MKTRLESTGTSPGIWNMHSGLWTLDFFYGMRMTQGYQLDHSLSKRLDNVLLENVGLTRVLPLTAYRFLCAEQVKGVILSHFCSLGCIIKDLLHA